MKRNNKKKLLTTVALIALLAGGGLVWCETHEVGHAPQVTAAHAHGEEEEGHKEDGHKEEEHGHGEAGHEEGEHAEGSLELTPAQIAEANIGVVTISVGNVAGQISVPGQIVTAESRRALVVPKLSGVVTETFKNIGDEVKKGEVLATIESRDMAEAVAEYLAASGAKELSQNTFTREKGLWEKKITAEQDYLDARNSLRDAEIKYDLATQKLQALGHSRDEIKSFAKESQPGNLRFHVLKSPISGRVIQKNIILGAHVDTEQTVYDIADTTVVWAEAAISANDAGLVSEGQTVFIKEGNNQVQGKVIFASPVIDPVTRSVKAIVEIENADSLWRPGSFVTLLISSGASKQGIVVPQAAVQSIEGKSVVFVQNEHGFERRDIAKGQESGDMVEILSGLKEGDVVATTNSFILKAELGKSEAGHEH